VLAKTEPGSDPEDFESADTEALDRLRALGYIE
jgi:hypothetical protein